MKDTVEKNRTRLLVIAKEQSVRNELVTICTGYGYFVDYAQSRKEGVRKFIHHKHAIVIMDVPTLPKHPHRLFRLFRVYKRHPIVLVAAHLEEEYRLEKFFDTGIYDIISLPVRVERIGPVLRRLVRYNTALAENEFMRMYIILSAVLLPVVVLFVFSLASFF